MEVSANAKGNESNGEHSSASQGAIPKVKQAGKLRALRTSIRDTSLKLRKKQSEQTEETMKPKGTKKKGTYKVQNETATPVTNPLLEVEKPSKISKATKLVRNLSIGKYRPAKSKTPSPSDGSPVLSKFTKIGDNSNSSSSSTNAVNTIEDFQSQGEDFMSPESGDSVPTRLEAAPLSCEKRSQSKPALTKESIKMQVDTSETPPIACDITKFGILNHSERSLCPEQLPNSSRHSNNLDKSDIQPDVHLVLSNASDGRSLLEKREDVSTDIVKTQNIKIDGLLKTSEVSQSSKTGFRKQNIGLENISSTGDIFLKSEGGSWQNLVDKDFNTVSQIPSEIGVNMAEISTSGPSLEPNAPEYDDDKLSPVEKTRPDVESREFLEQEKEVLQKSYTKRKQKNGEDSEEEFGDSVTKEESKKKPAPNRSLSQDSTHRVSSEKDTHTAQQGTEKREHLYKILVIGELGTGKTSIIKRYVHQFFSQHYRATIGVDFALKVLNWDSNTIIRLQLWDIAGQERFGNMTRVYYKEAVGAFVVFDVTRAATFDAVVKWKQDLDTKVQLPNGSSIPCILLANKCDQQKEGLANNPEKMDEYCKERGFTGWFETSAKVNINIEEAAKLLVTQILQNDKLIHDNNTAKDTEKFSIDGRNDQKTTKKSCSC